MTDGWKRLNAPYLPDLAILNPLDNLEDERKQGYIDQYVRIFIRAAMIPRTGATQ